MITKGVYRLNYRGLSFAEAWRLGGAKAFPIAMIMKLTAANGDYLWLPPSDIERPCPREELSEMAQGKLAPVAKQLEGMGYPTGIFSKLVLSLDPAFTDGGSYRALHVDRKRIIYVAFLRRELRQQNQVVQNDVLNPFGLFIKEDGRNATVVLTSKTYLDDGSQSKVIRLTEPGLERVARRLEIELLATREFVQTFPSIEAAAAATAQRDEAAWENRIQRGLAVKVAEDEERRVIAAARARMAASDTPPQSATTS
jgi:hypothetical protein